MSFLHMNSGSSKQNSKPTTTTHKDGASVVTTTTPGTSPSSLVKQESFQYWKQREDVNTNTNHHSSNNTQGSPSKTTNSTLSSTGKSKSSIGFSTVSSSNQIGGSFTATKPSPVKKSGSEFYTSSNNNTNNNNNSTKPTSHSAATMSSNNTTTTPSASKDGANGQPSSAQPGTTTTSLRNKPERKSIKTMFMDLWSKPMEEDTGDNGDSQDHEKESNNNNIESQSTPSKPTSTTTVGTPKDNNTVTKTNSIQKSSSKSSPSLVSNNGKDGKETTSSTTAKTPTKTTKSTTPSTTSTPTTPSAVKKTLPVSKSTPSVVTEPQSGTNNKVYITNTPITATSDKDETVPVKKTTSILKKTDAERMYALEQLTMTMSKQLEDLSTKLINETNQRKNIESYCNELEARIKLGEVRWKRSSTITTPPLSDCNNENNNGSDDDGVDQPVGSDEFDERETKEGRAVMAIQNQRDDQRIRSLILQVDILESRVQALETTNVKLSQEINTMAFEHSIFTSEKKKKALKKVEQREKELQKEREHREKELQKEREQKEKELLKEKQKTLKREKKDLKESSERQHQQQPAPQQQQEPTNEKNSKESTLTDSNESNGNNGGLSSSKDNNNNGENTTPSFAKYHANSVDNMSVSQSPKKVGFLESAASDSNKSKTQGYGNSLKKWAGKRMSVHLSSYSGPSQSTSSETTEALTLEKGKVTEERSLAAKGYFSNLYDGDIDLLRNEKLTRMRSRSLSHDPTMMDDEDDDMDDTSSQSSHVSNGAPKISITSNGGLSAALTLSNPSIPSSKETNEHQHTQDKKKGYSTIGRMLGLTLKEKSQPDPDREKITLLLSERLNHRASRDELIFKKIMVAESIFGIELKEDTLDRISHYLLNTMETLLENNEKENLFLHQVDDSQLNQFKESIEQNILGSFSRKDPYLVAQTCLNFFQSMPERLLTKITSPLLSTVLIDDSVHRRSLVKSAIFSLPPPIRQVLKMTLQFLRDLSDTSPPPSSCSTPSLLGRQDSTLSSSSPILSSSPPAVAVHPPLVPSSSSSSLSSVIIHKDQPANDDTVSNITVGDEVESTSPSGNLVKSNLIRAQRKPSKLTVAHLASVFAPVLFAAGSNQDSGARALVQLVADCDSHFETATDIHFIIKDNIPCVKSASFDKLFERLIDLSNRDTDYNYTVFYSYSYYSTSQEFLEKIIYYYRKTQAVPARPWQFELSLTVLSVAMFWMKLNQNQLSSDLGFLSKLKAFIESVQPIPNTQSTFFSYFKTFFQSLAPIQTLYARGNSFYSNRPQKGGAVAVPKDISDGPIDIYTLGAMVIATQISIIDNELLTSIPMSTFLHKAFTKPENSIQFQKMVDKFNEWARWTSTEILSKEKLHDRVVSMSFFIDVAKSCVDIGNFNAAAAIVGGLNHSSISRLKHTWEKLPTKVEQDYKHLETLYNMSMNYKNYRETLKSPISKSLKIIPYLALFPKDLIAIEEANDTYTVGGLINVEKFRLLYRIIKEIQGYQQQLFTPQSSGIKNYLNNLTNQLMDDKDLHAQSLKVEPRQSQPN